MIDSNSQKFQDDQYVVTRERFIANLAKFMSTSITFFRRESDSMKHSIEQLETMITKLQQTPQTSGI